MALIIEGIFISKTVNSLQIKIHEVYIKPLKWLDTVFWSEYLPRFSVYYVAISKDLEKLTPQLY